MSFFRPRAKNGQIVLCDLGCGERTIAKGLCSKHYWRARNSNRPRKPTGPDVYFWPFVFKTDDCWFWTGSKNHRGYGCYGRGTHRYSYRLHFGEIPDGLHVCHRCDNPGCVRPDHLFAGTPKQNAQDAKAKGRTPAGIFSRFAKLTEAQVYEIRASAKPPRDLAESFGVSVRTIYRIICGANWGPVAQSERVKRLPVRARRDYASSGARSREARLREIDAMHAARSERRAGTVSA